MSGTLDPAPPGFRVAHLLQLNAALLFYPTQVAAGAGVRVVRAAAGSGHGAVGRAARARCTAVRRRGVAQLQLRLRQLRLEQGQLLRAALPAAVGARREDGGQRHVLAHLALQRLVRLAQLLLELLNLVAVLVDLGHVGLGDVLVAGRRGRGLDGGLNHGGRHCLLPALHQLVHLGLQLDLLALAPADFPLKAEDAVLELADLRQVGWRRLEGLRWQGIGGVEAAREGGAGRVKYRDTCAVLLALRRWGQRQRQRQRQGTKTRTQNLKFLDLSTSTQFRKFSKDFDTISDKICWLISFSY